AGRHDLQLRRAPANLLARRPPDRVDAVRDVREGIGMDLAGAERGWVGEGSEVAVAAGLAQHAARVEEARAADEAAFEGLRQAVVGPADVADGREAAPEHAFEDEARFLGDHHDGPART